MIDLIAVAGPTASGKTKCAVYIAEFMNGEVVSCDSMQIYRHMDIGTAKPTIDEMLGIPHHMIDIVEPYDNFSCADYTLTAKRCIDDIRSRGKIPVLCGGTGLYLDSVLTDNRFAEHTSDSEIRTELARFSLDELHVQLQMIDPDSASLIHKNNVKRVIRALEIYRLTGKTKTQWDIESRISDNEYNAVIIGLDYRDRNTLYDRINLRVDLMIESGLVDEVESLDINKLSESTAGQAIGYKEVIGYLKNEYSYDEMIEKIKLNTRRYAKRQLTWFRRNKNINWYYNEDFDKEITKFKQIVKDLF